MSGRRGLLALIAASTLLLAAWGVALGSPGPADPAPVDVKEQEFSIEPSVSRATAGPITFKVVNAGKLQHELVFIRVDQAAGTLALEPDGTSVAEEASG